jgi:hypothetical protein
MRRLAGKDYPTSMLERIEQSKCLIVDISEKALEQRISQIRSVITEEHL